MIANKPGCRIKHCTKCSVELTDQNTYPSVIAIKHYICKKCYSKQVQTYYKKNYTVNPEFRRKKFQSFKKWRENNPKYYRNLVHLNYLKINRKNVKVKKRPLPDKCEFCDTQDTIYRLNWHHWDDEHPEKGLWVCKKCHNFCNYCEIIGKNEEKRNRYFELKKRFS